MKTILPQSRFLVFVFLIANMFLANVAFGQTVTLDQVDLDYAPGETVYITGTGWQPGETVGLEVDNLTNPAVDCGAVNPQPHELWTTVADENGNFTASWYVNDCELGADLLLGAYGNASGFTYEVFFTDGNSVTFNTPAQSGTVNSGVGGSVTYSFNISRDGAGNTFSTTLSALGLPTGVTASFSPNPLTFAPGESLTSTLTLTVANTVAAGTYTFTVTGTGGGSNNNITLTVGGCIIPSITTQPSNQTVTYGSNASFTVVASGTAPLTYQWQEQVSGVGVFTNLTNTGVYSGTTAAILTLTRPTVAMSTNKYRCVITNACGSVNSDGSATLTVNKKSITVSVNAGQSKVYGSLDSIFTYFSSEALLSGNSFSGALGRVAGEDFGTYAYTLNGLNAGANYS
ncbi:MAG: hypothetical protein RLZZ540_2024, partial [Bacteroidota bacterium]